nr:major allergen Can f 1 [Loxodonta africana]
MAHGCGGKWPPPVPSSRGPEPRYKEWPCGASTATAAPVSDLSCELGPLTMQTLFLTLVLGLIAILQAQANPDLYKNVSADGREGGWGFPSPDREGLLQVLGRWYLKAEIADKDVSEKNVEVVGPMTITALEGGNLEAKNTILMNGQCQEVKLVLEKTHEPRKFTAYGGERHVFIERTHVKDHYILYCEGQLKGQQVRMAKLVGEWTSGALQPLPPPPLSSTPSFSHNFLRIGFCESSSSQCPGQV